MYRCHMYLDKRFQGQQNILLNAGRLHFAKTHSDIPTSFDLKDKQFESDIIQYNTIQYIYFRQQGP